MVVLNRVHVGVLFYYIFFSVLRARSSILSSFFVIVQGDTMA
jgi:hypothetical protein